MDAYLEADISNAIQAYQDSQYPSMRACARAHSVSLTTLHSRLAGRNSRSIAHAHRQILSTAEEETLVKWIKRLTNTGYPLSPALAIKLAQEIRDSRAPLRSICDPHPPTALPALPTAQTIGAQWLSRFKRRHPEIQSIWARQIDAVRHKAMSFELVKQWFDTISTEFLKNQYRQEDIYNMDETGFAIGTSQSSRVLVSTGTLAWKKVNGRQEWVTAIECISASGAALPPLVIFKAQHTNTA